MIIQKKIQTHLLLGNQADKFTCFWQTQITDTWIDKRTENTISKRK